MTKTKTGRSTSIAEVSPDVTVLFSYQTPVGAKIHDRYVITSTNWSQTTTRHINQWLMGKPASLVSQSFLNSLVE